MNPTKERARVELDELKIRINKLKRFVEGERITTVSDEVVSSTAFAAIMCSNITRAWATLGTPVPFSWAVPKRKSKRLSPLTLIGTIEPGTERWLIFWKYRTFSTNFICQQ